MDFPHQFTISIFSPGSVIISSPSLESEPFILYFQKEKRKSLSIQQKIEILQKLDKGTKNHELCNEYGVSSSTISTILKNKLKIMYYYNEVEESHGDLKKKKIVSCPEFKLLDKIVYAWFSEKRTLGEPISGLLLQEKARFFYKQLEENGKVPEESKGFKASNGWLRSFKDRHGLRTLQLKGEKASANNEDSLSFITFFDKFLQDNNYDYENVYNADETGLLYRSLLNRTLVSATEKEVAGHKLIKDRLTVMFCANADGSHKIPPLLIGKSKKPRCFKEGQPLPIDYIHQKKAWMTTDIFLYWFREIFLKNVRSVKPHARFELSQTLRIKSVLSWVRQKNEPYFNWVSNSSGLYLMHIELGKMAATYDAQCLFNNIEELRQNFFSIINFFYCLF